MAKTINRVPFTVKTDPDIDYKFFAHGNWNGICTDKNYFNIDQETFEDANNVYIDSNGVLSSRPTVQQVLDADNDIQRQWQFGDVFVVLSNNYLYFDDRVSSRSVTKDVQLIENDGKIYVLDRSTQLDYYDKVHKQYVSNCKVYIPIKYTYTNMKRSVVAESNNILTDSYINRYVYSNPLNQQGSYVNFEALSGKTAVVTTNNGKDEFVLSRYTPYTLLNKTDKLPESLFMERVDIPPDAQGQVSLGKSVYTSSGTDISIFCKYVSETTKSIDGINLKLYTWDIYYTLDGLTYALFGRVDDCTSVPKVSQDGALVAIATPTSIKVKSTVSPGDVVFSDWYELHKLPDDYYTSDSTTFLDIADIKNYVILTTNIQNFKCIVVRNDVDIYKDFLYGSVIISPSHDIDILPIVSNGMSPTAHLNISGDTWSITILFSTTDTGYNPNVPGNVGIVRQPVLLYVYPSDDLVVAEKEILVNTYNITLSHINILDFASGATGIYVTRTERTVDEYGDEWDYNVITQYYNESATTEPTEKDFYTLNPDEGVRLEYSWEEYENRPRTFILDSANSMLYSSNGIYTVKLDDFGNGITAITAFTPYVTDIRGHILKHSTGTIVLGYDDYLYSDIFNDEISIDITEGDSKINIPKITSHTELNGHYIAYEADGKHKIAISSVGVNTDEFLWYFPERDVETFTNDIVDIHPISTNEMGVFLENEVWYIGQTESGHYTYTKSKLPLGCKKGSNVISSYDGKNLMMLTERGFVALSYQDFVASTDQVLSFLSDSIDEIFIPYIKNNICKLYKHKYWILVYSDSTTMYVYDIRNGSWWKWTLPSGVSYPITVNDEVSFVNSTLYKFTNKYDEYKDYNDNNIDWYIVSQKLHLNTLNYYKRLVNMTLNSLHAKDETQKMILSTTNYRDKSYEGLTSKPGTNNTLDYDVDLLRTYVKRLNYGKLVEFQYKLRNNERVELQPQLKLNSIIIKYVITGVIR